ncbi:MAG: hydrogen peroxide-inducible genes activator [Myxococcales bacterium]|nr:hydrogen peroxide-inducible genes activator [Myxococcales bacterium]
MPMDSFSAPDFSLRQLQYAVAVAELGGFGAAAKACGVSQPSLSAQVAKLEATLDVRLFERDPRQVLLTPAGGHLLGLFRTTLSAGAAVEVAARTLQDPYAIPARIAVIPTVAPYLIPPAVEALRAAGAGPKVHWLELKTRVAEEALSNGKVDAMVTADPPACSGVVVRQLGWEPFWAILPPAMEHPQPVSLEWLSTQDVLLLEDGHCLRDQTISLCMLPEAQESPFRTTSLPTLVQMVASGLGVSVLPAIAVATERERAQVTVRPFSTAGIGRTLRMAWREQAPLESMLVEIEGVLRRALLTNPFVVRRP